MGRNKNNVFKNAQNRENDLKSHNEKRKAQDSNPKELKNTQELGKFD